MGSIGLPRAGADFVDWQCRDVGNRVEQRCIGQNLFRFGWRLDLNPCHHFFGSNLNSSSVNQKFLPWPLNVGLVLEKLF